MKKVLSTILLIIFFTLESFAQTEQGTISIQPTAGLTIAKTSGSGAKAKAGIIGGAEFAYQIGYVVGISAGVMYSMEGCKGVYGYYSDDYGNVREYKLNYLNIPILANFYIFDALALKVGIQPGFNLSAKVQGHDIKANTKDYNFSIPFGVSYEIGKFVIDARYNLGVSDVFVYDWDNAKSRVFQITLGYKIPLNR